MLIYRFQDEQGRGPWTSSGEFQWVYDQAQKTRNKHHSCGDMPGPFSTREEGTELHNHARSFGIGDWRFGFTSKTQLKAAFPSSAGRAAMAKAGCRLMVFDVPLDKLVRGAAQCIFNPDWAYPAGELDLKTLKPKGVPGCAL